MSTGIYDNLRVRLQMGGFQVTRGPGVSALAETGPFFKVAQAGPSFTMKRGQDGYICRSKTNNFAFTGSIFTMKSNSLTNGFLSGLITADELEDNGAGVVDLAMEDMGGTDSFISDSCWLVKRPDLSKGPEDETIEWPIEGNWRVFIVGGN